MQLCLAKDPRKLSVETSCGLPGGEKGDSHEGSCRGGHLLHAPGLAARKHLHVAVRGHSPDDEIRNDPRAVGRQVSILVQPLGGPTLRLCKEIGNLHAVDYLRKRSRGRGAWGERWWCVSVVGICAASFNCDDALFRVG